MIEKKVYSSLGCANIIKLLLVKGAERGHKDYLGNFFFYTIPQS